MALIWAILFVLVRSGKIDVNFLLEMSKAGIHYNLLLFALNMLPFPPFDGGRVLIGLLPNKYALQVAKIEPYGFYIIAILILASDVIFNVWIYPVMKVATLLLNLLISPLTYFLN
jgi:Zn-dependent protease